MSEVSFLMNLCFFGTHNPNMALILEKSGKEMPFLGFLISGYKTQSSNKDDSVNLYSCCEEETGRGV